MEKINSKFFFSFLSPVTIVMIEKLIFFLFVTKQSARTHSCCFPVYFIFLLLWQSIERNESKWQNRLKISILYRKNRLFSYLRSNSTTRTSIKNAKECCQIEATNHTGSFHMGVDPYYFMFLSYWTYLGAV